MKKPSEKLSRDEKINLMLIILSIGILSYVMGDILYSLFQSVDGSIKWLFKR